MKTLIIAFKTFLFFSILTGIIYPFLITEISQMAFPTKANGSLILKDQKTIGSALIGQQFDRGIYFSSRPSATSYNTLPSAGSNYGLTNTKLKDLVEQRKLQFTAFNQLDRQTEIPSEMLFASASGLDPHISQRAAMLQVNRVAKARNYNTAQKQELLQCVKNSTEAPQYLLFGEERVNVLALNLKINTINQHTTNK